MIACIVTVGLAGMLLVLAALRAAPSEPRRRRVGGRAHPAAVVAAAIAGASAVLMVTALPVAAVLGGAATACVPSALARRRTAQERRLRGQAWPDVLDDVTSGVRAGLNLPEAITQAGLRVRPDLRPHFRAFDAQYRASGDFMLALDTMRMRLDDHVFDQLAHALMVTREVGGHDLTQVLRALGSFVRADLQVRGELLARQSWTVNSARLAVAAPWIVLALLSTRPSTIEAYSTPLGGLLLVGVAVFSAFAYAVMLRVARLDRA